MAWPWDRIPPWASSLLGPALGEVTERLKQPEFVAGVRQKLDHAFAEIPEAAARRVDQVVKTAKRAAESVQRWAADRTAPAVRIINASGTVFPSQCDSVPLAPEVALAWTGAVSTWSPSEDRNGTRAERALRAQLKSLAGCSGRMSGTWPSAVIAACSTANGKVLVPRIAARDIGHAGALPDLLRAASIQVVEFGSVAGSHGHSNFDAHLEGAAIVVWSDDPQLPSILAASASQSMLKIVIARYAWPRDLGWNLESTCTTWQGLIEAGADLIVVPSNELLGGPAGGLILGTEDKLSALDRHPLWHALRADSATHAACCTAVELWTSDQASQRLIPLNVIRSSIENVRHRASQLAIRLDAMDTLTCETIDCQTRIWPDAGPTLPSVTLRVMKKDVSGEAWSKRLAQHVPLVWCGYDEHAILLDVRTIEPAAEAALLAALGGEEASVPKDFDQGQSEPTEASVSP